MYQIACQSWNYRYLVVWKFPTTLLLFLSFTKPVCIPDDSTFENELNLPKPFINRHPFPGPGLAIRCPGEVTIKKIKILQNIDEIFIDQIKKYNLYDEIWQAFSVLLPTKSVGVMGDNRTYDYACVLRAVTSVDGMTADYFKFDQSFLSDTSTRIINEVSGVNRVTYDITSKPPGTIEWE